MKQKINILAALFCIAFLFASCVNPTQTESGSKPKSGSGGGGGTIGGGTKDEIVEDSEFGIGDILPAYWDAEKSAGELNKADVPVLTLRPIPANVLVKLPEDKHENKFFKFADKTVSENGGYRTITIVTKAALSSGTYTIYLELNAIFRTFTFTVTEPDPTPTANDFDVKFEGAGERDGIPTISGAALDTSEGSVTLATVTPPKKGGPWTMKLDDAALELFDIEYGKNSPSIEENRLKALFAEGVTEDDAEGDEETAVDDWDFANIVLKKDKTLGWGRYSINLVIKGADEITIYKTFTFDVVLTPAPFTKTPSLYPEITGAGKNKLTVNWSLASGAERYNVYINTTTERPQTPNNTAPIDPLTQSCDITDIDGDDTDGGLPNGTKYYVWVEAVNDGGSSFSDPAERTTSYDIDDFFYYYIEPGTRKIMYSWDSFTGGGGGIDCYRILAPVPDNPGTLENEYTPARMLYGRVAAGIGTTGWTAEIVYFDKFPDGKDENGNYLRPDGTRTGRLEESLLDEQENETPAGVFIVKYDNPYGERIYQGVYYYGRVAVSGFGPLGK